MQLWKHLEERIPEFPLRLDDAAKRFLWKGIVNTLDIEFFVLPEPLPHIFNSKCDEPSKNEKDDKKPKNPLDEVLMGVILLILVFIMILFDLHWCHHHYHHCRRLPEMQITFHFGAVAAIMMCSLSSIF